MSSSNNCGPPEARGSDDDLRGLEIFLVEDSQSVADALKQHLELLGAQVAGPAATPAEATKLIAERLPHVALVDFHLRGGDSSALIAQLRDKGVPVIMLSGSFEFPAPVSPEGVTMVEKPISETQIFQYLKPILKARPVTCGDDRHASAETRRRWLRGAAIDKMPKVEVHVVQSPEAPTGVGGRRSGWAAALPGGPPAARLSRGGPLRPTISRADPIPLKRIALALPSSAESITLLHGDERAKCGAAAEEGVQVGPRLGLVGSMEATAILPKGQKYIKPLRCSECGGNAVLIRRSPHPLDGSGNPHL